VTWITGDKLQIADFGLQIRVEILGEYQHSLALVSEIPQLAGCFKEIVK
jgi:hypothetical protein